MPLAQRYTMTAQLAGSGGWTLHRACAVDGGAPALIELLDPSRGEPDGLERLRHAQEAAAALGGPPALRSVELGTYRGIPALVLEAFEGAPLAGEPEPLAAERVLPLAAALAAALAALHRRGIVHRRLRPACVLAGGNGEVRLVDLGLSAPPARAPDRSTPPLLEATLPYLAPEQTGRLAAAVDGRADLYALGVILYRLLTGRLPFEASDPLEWIHCHVAQVPAPPAERCRGVPPLLSEIVVRLLAKMPDDRYQSAGGLRHDLERCLEALRAGGEIEPFPLGERDRSERLQLPQRLYGRGDDVLAVLRAFQTSAADARPRLALVSGAPGVGKSTLVLDAGRRMVDHGALFAAAKSDPTERDVPYSTFVRAFRDLVLGIASRGPAEAGAWRGRILEAVGASAQVLVDVFPALEAVIGPQPPAAALPPEEARNRFSLLLQRFVNVLGDREHPLVVFLDDLQWADPGTLSLLRLLLTDTAARHLLVIGAYRDSEVGPGHPLRDVLAALRGAGVPVTDLRLAPLSPDQLVRFVGDALRCGAEEAAPLAALVAEKTAGNPFFAVQFLTELHDERLLTLDAASGRWRWDVEGIRAKGFTDSVVDLMLTRLRRLPPRTVEVLEEVASLGGTPDLGTVAAVHGRSEAETEADLADAVHAGLVVSGRDGFRLVHDRVQEAAYSLVPPDARPAHHLRAGRRLLAHVGEARLDERIFDVVTQLDRGLALVADDGERDEILRLNARAGRKAKAAVAFESARAYLRQAVALLPAGAWERRPADVLSLKLDLAECECLAGGFDAADALLAEVLAHARDRRDRARACAVRMRLYQVAGRWDRAVDVALDALRAFGIVFPEEPEDLAAATRDALAAVPGWLRGRRVADLAGGPAATDPDVRASIALLVTMCPCANVARPAVFPLAVLTALRLTLEHGHTEESCFAYSAWACLLVALLGDAPAAHEFSRMSMALNERLGDARLRGILQYLHANFVHFWSEPLASVFPIQARALAGCLEAGDLVFAAYLVWFRTWQHLERGAPLDEVLAAARADLSQGWFAPNESAALVERMLLQIPRALQGVTGGEGRLDDDGFDQAAYVEFCRRSGSAMGHDILRVGLLTTAAFYGRWEDAVAVGRELDPGRPTLAAQYFEASWHCYFAVALAALSGRAPGALGAEVAGRLPDELARLERWAAACPANFGAVLALVRAEVARGEGRDLEALRQYEAAIASAREAGFTHREALACELAATFHRERGLHRLAEACLRDARDLYLRWGALGKVRQLEERHPALRQARPGAPAGGAAAPLDLLSVVKASQSISQEIVAERLVERLLTVALELGGARRAVLVLARGDALELEAGATLEADGVSTRALASRPVDGSAWVPAALVRRAWLTREPVIVDADADAGPGPGAAPAPARSQLALPIGQQARIAGVLYLENDLVAGAFTRERLTALELIGFQAAISVENARLFREAQRTSVALAAANAQLKAEMGERSEAEAARAAAEVQLRQAQKMQSIGLLAGGVAHDFNNLLTPILGNAECIADDLGPGHPDAELLAEIRDAAHRARELTRQLLAVGRRQILELHPVDLGALVAGFERMIRRVIREDIRLEVHVAADLGAVRADESQLGQVLLNLAVNAQDAMPRAGVLGLAARNELLTAADPRPAGLEPGEYVVLSVTDTGTGMDLGTQERLFEPFFTTKPHGKGTGLGLSTAYGIVRQHGGIVTVVSEPGRGSTFEVYLPRLAGDAAPAPAPAPAPALARGAGETVLVLEDEPAVRHTACELVRRLGYRVLAAADVASAERTALDEGGRLDLLLTDVVMPGANGKQAFERLRPLCPGLRVLYMSGYASEIVVHRGVVDEGVHFIHKPLSLEALGVKLREALGR